MGKVIKLPGLIDPHVHFRDPGQTHKEDFYTGTSAALAGGYTTVMDMPNNTEPITTLERLDEKTVSAKKQIVCDIGFHFGTLGDNFDLFPQIIKHVTGLKVYMNITTGNFIINTERLIDIYNAWPGNKPILLHAEDDVSKIVLETLKALPKPTHICHVSSEAELTFVMKAKDLGLPITCGVTPHHLFLTEDDVAKLGSYGKMKPSLKSKKDQTFIWDHLDGVDVIESDHAPHTKKEKDSAEPPMGVPGIETTLPLMLTAANEGKLNQERVTELLHTNPAKIFNIKTDRDTNIEVDMGEYEIRVKDLLTKCGWSPFAGKKVVGKVIRVNIGGTTVFKDGNVLTSPGSGKIIC